MRLEAGLGARDLNAPKHHPRIASVAPRRAGNGMDIEMVIADDHANLLTTPGECGEGLNNVRVGERFRSGQSDDAGYR